MSAVRFDRGFQSTVLFFLFLIFFYIYFYLVLDYKPYSDDFAFLAAANSDQSVLDYVLGRYNGWSGRAAIEFIMFLTIAHPLFWKLAIPSLLLFAAYATWKALLTTVIDCRRGIPLCIFLLFLMGGNIFDETVYYVTGFYNYLIPASAAIFVCAVFARPLMFSALEKIFAFPLALIASQSEQVGVSLICIFFAFLLWGCREQFSYRAMLLLVVLVGFLFLVAAPGNYVRLASEVRYMPEFSDYSLFRKLSIGLDVYNSHYIDPGNLYPKILAGLMLLLAVGKSFKLKGFAFCLMLLGVFQGTLLFGFFDVGHVEMYSTRHVSSGLGLWYFFSYLLTVLSLVSSIYISSFIVKDNASFGLIAILFLLSFGVTLVIGLSPTAYESGERVFWVGGIISFGCICLLAKEYLFLLSTRSVS